MKRLAFIILILMFVSACAGYAPINTSAFELGASKSEVRARAGGRLTPVGSKRYGDDAVEVLEASRRSHWDSSVVERYWLYFVNDELDQWGRPGDWEKEADEIIDVRYR